MPPEFGAVRILNRVNITSADNLCSLLVERRRASTGDSGFRIAARADIGHGYFQAGNGDVRLINLRGFVAELDRFVLDRRRSPRLDGTHDTFLSFAAAANTVTLRYCIGDAFHGRATVLFHQSGAFEIDEEKLLQYLSAFQALLQRDEAPA